MKLIATLIATMFAVSAFAADAQPAKQPEPKPAVTAPAAPHKTDKKAEVKPHKSTEGKAAPAKKEEAKPAASK